MSFMNKLRKIPVRGPEFLSYLYHQKWRFGITNTKFDISFTVFRESFLSDAYLIKDFAHKLNGTESLLFIDVGRNHGFVFYYFLDYLVRSGLRVGRIQYFGIDPSPLKFAYYDKPISGMKVEYRLIDKAVVFDGSETVKLKYGERNIGNFNVTGSNYEKRMKQVAKDRVFIEIEVECLQIEELLDLVDSGSDFDSVIVKIDCKNRNEVIMEGCVDRLAKHSGSWLCACERDGSSEGRLQARAKTAGAMDTLVMSNKEL